MSVCVVDDSEVGREVIKKALTAFGYEVGIEARDGVEALEKVKAAAAKPELFILDINMPRMDGLTLLGELRKLHPVTPIIMLTTETDKEKMVKAKSLGATGWIVKPFNSQRFIEVIKMVLQKS